MASEVARALSARVRLERHEASDSSFLLDVSLQIPAGITILFGASGAGKSTLLDCIAGILQPDVGNVVISDSVLFDSNRGVNLPPQHRRIAYVFQTLALFPHMNVEENVAYGLSDLPEALCLARVTQILEAFRVEKLRRRKPTEISGGERQRVALARSLVTLPRALLLDEPLTGLDAELKASIIDDLRAWNAGQNIPVLYVTHSRDEVDALGEHVVAMEHGHIMSEGTPQEVLDAPKRVHLAQVAGFENLMSGTVTALRPVDGIMRVRLSNTTTDIEVPLGHAAPGDLVRLAIRAGDILLATRRPDGLSARNLLEGKIISLERRGPTIVVQVDCGAIFTVHVTPSAERALQLAPAKPVWLVLKTHSCHLVDE